MRRATPARWFTNLPHALPWALALLLCAASCSGEGGDEKGNAGADVSADGGQAGDAAVSKKDSWAQTYDAAGGTGGADGGAATDAGSAADAGEADAGATGGDNDAGSSEDAGADDANADAVSSDATAADAASSDAGSDAASTDAGDTSGVADPCGTCPFDKQPKAPHPGAKGSCSLLSPKEVAYGSGFGQGYKDMLVLRPTCAGSHPVLFFVHGKSLYESGGIFSAKLGAAYMKYLEHVASHGVIVAFVRVEQGLLDGDHKRMADDLLAATKKLFDTVSVANDAQVVFAGHSMGAKVALLAAAKTIADDSKKQWVNPRAVLAFSPSNEKPPIGNFVNAVDALKTIPANTELSVTFVQPEDDAIAPYKDPAKPNAMALYDALKVGHKQLIVLHGTGKGDPNPPSSPELHDDHSAPMTIVGKPGGVADFAMPASYLDALDWYGFWKITVGAINFHFKQGDKTWAYGAMRTHGGTLPGGKVVTHEVVKEQWKSP